MALLVPAVMSEVNRKAWTSLKPKPKSLTADFICNSKRKFKQTYYLITDLILGQHHATYQGLQGNSHFHPPTKFRWYAISFIGFCLPTKKQIQKHFELTTLCYTCTAINKNSPQIQDTSHYLSETLTATFTRLSWYINARLSFSGIIKI